MQNIQCIQELSDEDLKCVLGGTGNTPSFASASVNAVASAVGGRFHINQAFVVTDSVTTASTTGQSSSIAIGFAYASAF